MKTIGKLSAIYPELNLTRPIASCEDLVRDADEDIYRDMALNIRKQSRFRKLTPCIMAELRRVKWAEDEMLFAIYSVDVSMSADESRPKLSQIGERGTKTLENSMATCMFEKQFGSLYDKLTSAATNMSERSQEELISGYCTRKHLQAKKMVGESVFTGVFNPKTLNADKIDCSSEVEKALKKVEITLMVFLNEDDFDLTDLQANCALNKFLKSNISNKLLTILVLSDYDVAAAKKALERQSFVEYMTKMFAAAGVCEH